jgi:hypothetical protein
VQRDPFGRHRVVRAKDDVALRACRPSLAALLAERPSLSRVPDIVALRAHLDGPGDPTRTLLAVATQLAPGTAWLTHGDVVDVVREERRGHPGDVDALLLAAVRRVVTSGRRVAIALSGGLDSALVLALVRACAAVADVDAVPCYVLAPRFGDYDESDTALATAAAFGARAVVVDVEASDFLAALPAALAAVEVPLYNLHPVAKLLLARRLVDDGVEVVLTGDAADHVMRRDVTADYLPLVGALHDAAGLALASPFLDDAVVDALLFEEPDPGKTLLRAIAARRGVPRALVETRKRARLCPPLDVSGLVDDVALEELGALVERPVPRHKEADLRTRHVTLAWLLRHLGALAGPR